MMSTSKGSRGRSPRALAALLALAMVAGACSGGDTSGSAGAPTTGGEAAAPDTSRLRVAVTTFGAESFDPTVMSTATAFEVLSPLYDSLVGQDYDGEIAPAVAESWEINAADNEVVFKIRQGMTFHNGEALTAEDVKYSLMRWFDPEVAATVTPPYAGLLEDPDRDIEIVDDFTLKVSTPLGPASRFVETVSLQQQHEAYVLPKDYLEEVGVEAFLQAPVGSGPWKFLETRPGESILYGRVDEPHGYRLTPAFAELELILVDEEATRLALLQTGDVDIIAISPDSVEAVESYGGFRIGEAEGSIQVHLFFNGTWSEGSGPFADVRVREALSLAIDRQELVDTIMRGYGTPVSGAVPGEFFPGMADLEIEDWGGELYNPDRARELLAEAGVTSANLPIYAFNMSGAPFLSSLGEIFLGYWGPYGITGEIRSTDLATFFDLAEQENLDERTIGTLAAFRRRKGYDGSQAINGYDPNETPGGSIIGPSGDTLIPDVEARIAEVTAARGERRNELVQAFLKDVSDLYIAPVLFYGNSLWGVGNRAGEWTTVKGVGQLGMVYETVQPNQG